MDFTGAWTAIVTPMQPDGSIDWDGLQKNIEFQISEGISGVVPAGTTGESPTLDWEEQDKVISRALSLSEDKCGVIAGTGSNSTEEAVSHTKHAVDKGAKAALLVDCYYNGPSSLELRKEYYGVLASEFPDTAFVPYVIPGRSGTALSVEDLAILYSEHPNVNAVKEATGDLERMAATRRICGPAFNILSGDDDITYTMLSRRDISAQGVISVVSNVAPAAVKKMVAKAIEGDMTSASVLKDALAPLFGIVTVKADSVRLLPNGSTAIVQDRFRNPVGIKSLMNALGIPAGPCRRPLGKMTSEGVNILRKAVRMVWESNPDILQPVGRFYGVDIEARIADDAIWESLSYS